MHLKYYFYRCQYSNLSILIKIIDDVMKT